MFQKKVFTLFLTISLSVFLFSQEKETDTIFIKSSYYLIPNVYYQPETSWAFGLAGAYYFKNHDIRRISSITGSAYYTLNQQFTFNITPKIYFSNSKFYLYSNVNAGKFPYKFYDIGNQPPIIEIPYTSKFISVSLQPQYEVQKHFFVGLAAGFRYEETESKNEFFKQNNPPYYNTSIGTVATYDTRNNLFYPTRGIFAKLTGEISSNKFLSNFSIFKTSVDVRQFIPVFKNHVFAWQLYGQNVAGTEIPFQLLPAFGGADLMRGFFKGMYSDHTLAVLQTEYRVPLVWRLKVAAFASAGDVFGTHSHTEKLKIAYGLGLRCRLNDTGVHFRIDFAKNNFGEPIRFYITATEAF